MRRLVFVDDDPTELKNMQMIVEGSYTLLGLHWPGQKPTDENQVGEPPDVFVLDLYLPPGHRAARSEMRAEKRREQEILARELAASFAGLYTAAPHDDKKLLRETMTALQKVYDLLKRQWEELEQSPENGLQVLRELKAHGRYGKIPVVFYSRKITPEDVLRVLEAGAVDAIRKRYPGDDPRAQRDWVLQRLDRAQHVHRLLPAYHLNVNTTLFPA